MKIIVYEHVSGGGYSGQPIPPSVLSEGYAMLCCIAADFKAAGHEVTVLLDERLSKLNPPLAADCTVPIFYANEPQSFLTNIAKVNDAIYVIAPETGQILQSLVKTSEDSRKVSLNSESGAIGKVADKAALNSYLHKKGFPTPKTVTLKTTCDLAQIKKEIKNQLSYPIILKPLDGAGCSGISFVKSAADLKKATAKIKAESSLDSFIAQEYISGEAVSVSLLSNGVKAVALSLNMQNVTLAPPDETSRYYGGCTPFSSMAESDALALAEKVVECIGGLKGYVGVDLVISGKKLFVLDVNARLTTSYIGLRETVAFNVAEALVDAVVDGKLPPKPQSNGAACFQKIQTPQVSVESYRKIAEMKTAVSPAFPLDTNAASYSLLVAKGGSMEEASLRLEEAKKSLCRIIG